MAKRMLGCDVLGEVRRALRTLRRVERWLVQQQRADKRAAAKARDRHDSAQRLAAAARELASYDQVKP